MNKILILALLSFAVNATLVENRFYTDMESMTSQTSTWIIPDGVKVYLSEIGGDASQDPSTSACIIWDGEIILSTSGDAVQKTNSILTGDGIKKLEIFLENTAATKRNMGAYYRGEKF